MYPLQLSARDSPRRTRNRLVAAWTEGEAESPVQLAGWNLSWPINIVYYLKWASALETGSATLRIGHLSGSLLKAENCQLKTTA